MRLPKMIAWAALTVITACFAVGMVFYFNSLTYTYRLHYDKVLFLGETVKNGWVYNQVILWRGNRYPLDFNDAQCIQSIANDKSAFNGFSVFINAHEYQLEDLRFSKLTNEIKPKNVQTEGDISWFSISSSMGVNPPYSFSMSFWKDEIIAVCFRIRKEPDSAMQAPSECPIWFSYHGKQFKLPITLNDIEKLLGKPLKQERHLRDWI